MNDWIPLAIGAVVILLPALWVLVQYNGLVALRNHIKEAWSNIDTEDRIQAARRFFNGNVRDYRNKCEQFPSSLVASVFGFEPRDYFDLDPGVREVPSTQF